MHTRREKSGLSGELAAETQRFWQARTGEHLSEEDAREAIRNIAAFFDLLARWDRGADDGTTAHDTEVDHDGTS